MGLLDKVKDLLSKNADKVDTAIDKAGDVVDDKTQASTKTPSTSPGRSEEGRRQWQPEHLADGEISVDVPLPPEAAWDCGWA